MRGHFVTKVVVRGFALGLTLVFAVQGAHAAEVVQFYHTDAAGTPVAMTDSAGTVVWRQSQQPFGVPQSTTGIVTNALGIAGRPVDPETGLVDLGARWYSPKLGRFLQVDPALRGGLPERVLLEPQRLNPYAYGLNNPYRYTDPDGQLAETLWDVVSIGYSAYQLYQEPSWANVGWLALDVGAALTPFVPAVGGVRIVGKGAEQAAEAAKGADVAKGASGSAADAVNAVRLRNQLAAQEIAGGHAFEKHVLQRSEFSGIQTRQQFASEIERIMNNPSAVKQLEKGRTAYWDDATSTVVIRNPSVPDGGTAFKPSQGKTYFENLY